MTYEYWEKALADPKALRNREFRITGEPQPGYYRTWRMLEPVAIWRDEATGQTVIQVNGYEPDPDDYETIWLHSAKNPVSEAAFQKALDGGGWDDLDEAVAVLKNDRRNDPASIIDELAGQAAKYQEITDDDEARRAISLQRALQEQGAKVDKVREAEKAPHLRAEREVDEVYMPAVKLAKTWSDYLRHLVEAFETKKRVAAREAAFRADMARLANTPPTIEVFPQPADQIRGGFGRAASVRTKMVVTDISDFAAVVRHYTEDARVWQALIAIAQQDVNAGQTVPGVTVEEQAVVR